MTQKNSITAAWVKPKLVELGPLTFVQATLTPNVSQCNAALNNCKS